MLSIVIPAFNEEHNIKDTIQNVLNAIDSVQYAIEYEIIIVNDCSTDKTKVVSELLQDQYKNIILLNNKENQGFGKSFKIGLSQARGDRIMWLQGDNAWDAHNLKKLLKKFKLMKSIIVFNQKY